MGHPVFHFSYQNVFWGYSSHSCDTPRAYDDYMPRGLRRYYGAGDLHFITCSCYHRQPLLGAAKRRDLLLSVLEQVRVRYRLAVLGYVVIPEHFHLLITEPQTGTPSTVMQALKLGFARRVLVLSPLLAKSARNGAPSGGAVQPVVRKGHAHVWQRRFHDFNVRTERKRIEKLRYIHRNPVTRGLVAEPD
jgi:putative transposase